MKEFRIGLIEVVPYPDRKGGGGAGECQSQVHLHSLSNIKSEDRDSALSMGIYGTGTYVCVLE